jgi:hypothetical protein
VVPNVNRSGKPYHPDWIFGAPGLNLIPNVNRSGKPYHTFTGWWR